MAEQPPLPLYRDGAVHITSADERAGFQAFPAGRYMDAVRGTKSYPDEVRCPFRRPDRVAAWNRGYEAARDAIMDNDFHNG